MTIIEAENEELKKEVVRLRDSIELHRTKIINEYGEDQVKEFDLILWGVLE